MTRVIHSILGLSMMVLLSGCQHVSMHTTDTSQTGANRVSEMQEPISETEKGGTGGIRIKNRDRYDRLVSGVKNTDLLKRVEYDFSSSQISEIFFLDILSYLAGEKTFSPEIQGAFFNIETYLRGRTDTTLIKEEIYYPLADQLLPQFMGSLDDCAIFGESLHPKNRDLFQKDCEFQWYLMTSLRGEIKNTPAYLKEYSSLFEMLGRGKCDLQKNYTCYLIGNQNTYSNFVSDVSGFLGEGTDTDILLANIPPVNIGYALFREKSYPLDKKSFLDTAYDAAVLLSARKNNPGICDQSKNPSNRQFCKDIGQKNREVYYKNLFSEFYQKLYLMEKGLK